MPTERLLELRADPEFRLGLTRLVMAFPPERRCRLLAGAYTTVGRQRAGRSPSYYLATIEAEVLGGALLRLWRIGDRAANEEVATVLASRSQRTGQRPGMSVWEATR